MWQLHVYQARKFSQIFRIHSRHIFVQFKRKTNTIFQGNQINIFDIFWQRGQYQNSKVPILIFFSPREQGLGIFIYKSVKMYLEQEKRGYFWASHHLKKMVQKMKETDRFF